MAVNINENYLADSGAKSWLTGGTLYFATIDGSDNVTSGYESMGYVDSIDINFETTKAELQQSLFGAKASASSVVTEKTGAVAITLRDYKSSNAAKALFGAESSAAAAAATIEVITAKHDLAVPLAGFIDATGTLTVKDDATKLVTYVEGTDYIVSDGFIYALSTGSISNDEALEVTYDKVAQEKIEGFTLDNLNLALYFEGKNLDDNKRFKVFMHKVQLDPTTAYNLLSTEDFGELVLNGTLLSSQAVSGAGLSKYYQEIREA